MKNLLFVVLFIFTFIHYSFSQDECTTATVLNNVDNFCSTTPYSNNTATPTNLSYPSCWGSLSNNDIVDVWFKFVATGSNLTIDVTPSSSGGIGGYWDKLFVALYTGDCVPASTYLTNCTTPTSYGSPAKIKLLNITKDQTYFIRIGSRSSYTGTFDLCIDNYEPAPVASADCGGAIKLCNKNPQSAQGILSNGVNKSETNNVKLGTQAMSEHKTIWYYFTCGTPGTLTFNIKPKDISNDIDFGLYQVPGNNACGTLTALRINTTSCIKGDGSSGLNLTSTDIQEASGCNSSTQDAFSKYIDMTENTTYVLVIDNANGDAGFDLTFGGTGTFSPAPVITLNPNKNNICVGDKIDFSGSTTKGFTSLNWTFTSSGSPQLVSGATASQTYNTDGIFTEKLVATNNIGCKDSITQKIYVNKPPKIDLTPTTSNLCPNSTVNLTGNITTYGTIANTGVESPNTIKTITWIPSTGPNITLTNTVLPTTPYGQTGTSTTTASSVSGTVKLSVSDQTGCTNVVTSTINVSGPTAPTCSGTSVCKGAVASVTATGNTGATFKWYDAATNGNVVSNSATYSPTINAAVSYWVTQTIGSCESERTKVDFTLKTVETPSIQCGSSTINSVEFNWAASTGATSYTVSYNPGSGIITSSETLTTKKISGLTAGQTIALTVTPVGTGCYSPATFSCTANNCPSPTITTQPVNVTICEGSKTSFSVVQTGGSTFKWQVSTNGGSTYTDVAASSIYSGENTTTLSISDVTGLKDNKYQVIVYPSTGTCSLTSTPATLTVNTIPTATISSDVSQCDNVSSPTVTFTGSNGTAPYTFTYSKNGTGGSTLVTSSGNTASIIIPSTPASVNSFEITKITDNNGCTKDITGQSNKVTIKAIEKPTLTCGNSTTSSITYNWTSCSGVTDYSISTNTGTGAINAPNQTGLTFTLNGVTSGGSAKITVTPNGTGCYTSDTLTCIAKNCPSPTIDTQPISVTKCAKETASFTIAQTGGASIQWQISTNGGQTFSDVVASSIYSGEKTISLAISDVSGLNGTIFKAKVTEAGGTCYVISNPATLTVNVLPTATITGTNAICFGKSTDLNIVLTGNGPWNFSYSDGTNTTAVNNALSSPNKITVTPSIQTTYSLVSIADANCTGTFSGSAIITVNAIPVATPLADSTLCHSNTKTAIIFESTPSGASFDWVNTDVSINLPSKGTGNIGAFKVTNTTISPITNTITATPTLAGCVGSPIVFHLTINPVITTKITATDSTMSSISFKWDPVTGATNYLVSESIKSGSTTNPFNAVNLASPIATTYTKYGLTMRDRVTLNVVPKGAIGTCFLPASLTAMTDTCKQATITSQPVSVGKCITGNASFSFAAKGNATISGIQWQLSNDGVNWNNVSNTSPYSGATTTMLNISNLNGLNGLKYRASILGTLNACEIFTDIAELTVYPLPTANFSMDKTTGCAPLNVTFTDNSGYSDATITWDFGDGTTMTKNVDMDLTESHIFQLADSFNISLIVNRNGCLDTMTQKVKVVAPAVAKFIADQTTLPLLDSKIQLTNLSSANSVIYKWTFDDNSPISTAKNPKHEFDGIPGEHIVTLYTSSIFSFSDTNCVDVYKQKITILDDIIYYIPNTFTPNGDEINNTFQPIFYSGFDPQNYYFVIYNRWGEVIFESLNPAYGWDGTYNNKIAETATYLWKVQFKEKQTEKEHIKTGHLNLIR